MSYMDLFKVPEPLPELSRKTAIVGLGESDFHADYQAARAKAPGYEGHTTESLAIIAFERALADSGLKREDIDGLGINYLYGSPSISWDRPVAFAPGRSPRPVPILPLANAILPC
jgi:hypothetical protein